MIKSFYAYSTPKALEHHLKWPKQFVTVVQYVFDYIPTQAKKLLFVVWLFDRDDMDTTYVLLYFVHNSNK